MQDTEFNIHTYDFEFRSLGLERSLLPGTYVSEIVPFADDGAGCVTHRNTLTVARFIRDVLQRNGLDRNGAQYTSSVNCTNTATLSTPREWLNAAWLPREKQVVYGQKRVNGELLSYGTIISIVAHELFHGVTQFTARLQCVGQSGALNESYSDIFAVLVANFSEPDLNQWNWQIGEPMGNTGLPIRDLCNPKRHDQPDHMNDYRDTTDDQGGVHINNGIHNKAAYNLITARNQNGQFLFDARTSAALFYGALIQLAPTSGFQDSRRALLLRGNTMFRRDPQRAEKLKSISKAFDQVGIV